MEGLLELFKYIDKSQLTPDYGGSFYYKHLALGDFCKVSFNRYLYGYIFLGSNYSTTLVALTHFSSV